MPIKQQFACELHSARCLLSPEPAVDSEISFQRLSTYHMLPSFLLLFDTFNLSIPSTSSSQIIKNVSQNANHSFCFSCMDLTTIGLENPIADFFLQSINSSLKSDFKIHDRPESKYVSAKFI